MSDSKAAAKAAEEAAAKAAEEADDLIELSNGVETVRAHETQVEHWGKCGYFPTSVTEEA